MNETQKILQFFLVMGRMERQIQKLKTLYMKEFDLKGADLPILCALAQEESGLLQEELVDITGADKSQVSRSLHALMDAGMVNQDSVGKYRRRCALSEKGREAAEKLSSAAGRIFAQAHLRMDDAQWDGFYAFLAQLGECLGEIRNQKENEGKQSEQD